MEYLASQALFTPFDLTDTYTTDMMYIFNRLSPTVYRMSLIGSYLQNAQKRSLQAFDDFKRVV